MKYVAVVQLRIPVAEPFNEENAKEQALRSLQQKGLSRDALDALGITVTLEPSAGVEWGVQDSWDPNDEEWFSTRAEAQEALEQVNHYILVCRSTGDEEA
jgi:hypothetical protein